MFAETAIFYAASLENTIFEAEANTVASHSVSLIFIGLKIREIIFLYWRTQ